MAQINYSKLLRRDNETAQSLTKSQFTHYHETNYEIF